jgi:hypothetical protein
MCRALFPALRRRLRLRRHRHFFWSRPTDWSSWTRFVPVSAFKENLLPREAVVVAAGTAQRWQPFFVPLAGHRLARGAEHSLRQTLIA